MTDVTLVKCDWIDGKQVFRQVTSDGQIHFGEDDTGLDIKFYGATASANMLWDESADDLVFSGAAGINLGSGGFARTAQRRIINNGAKVGATSTVGWGIGGGAVDTGMIGTLAASATADTLVIPIPNLKVGDTLTAFSIHGQVESDGNVATLDADLRAMTPVATGSTDASIGAITQVSKTADYLVNESKSALTETVTAGKGYYILVTGTTAASTDIEVTAVTVTVTEA